MEEGFTFGATNPVPISKVRFAPFLDLSTRVGCFFAGAGGASTEEEEEEASAMCRAALAFAFASAFSSAPIVSTVGFKIGAASISTEVDGVEEVEARTASAFAFSASALATSALSTKK